MTDATAPVLEMRGIKKSFGSVTVLDGVDLTLRKGEVLGLIGENGAGKSTLIKIICGIHQATAGAVYFDGLETAVKDADAARQMGVSVIYQELSLAPDLNAWQNIFLNREAQKGFGLFAPLSARLMRREAKRVLEDELGVRIDVDKPLRYLPLAQKQMVEIARTVHADAKIIIMDEPTAALEAPERARLFQVIRGLKAKGRSVIFVSHHLDEIMEICDTVNVLRDGLKVSDGPVSEFSIDRIIADMVGKSLQNQYPKEAVPMGDTVLEMEGLSQKGKFEGVTLSLRRGEVVGIVGLEGCGKNELIRAIFGIKPADKGVLRINGKDAKIKNITDAMRRRVAFVPGERKTAGIFPERSIAWNTTIASLKKITAFGTLSGRAEKAATQSFIEQLNTKTEGPKQIITRLSGGNQQKVMLSRWIMTDADVFLLEEPTRGIDVNAKTEVYRTITACLKQQKGVLVVSSEEEEVCGICDRIVVMRGGRVAAVLNASETSTEQIKQLSIKSQEAAV